MIFLDDEPLRSIGFSFRIQLHLQQHVPIPAGGDPPFRLMRLIEVHRDAMQVHDGRVEQRVRVMPRVLRTLDDAGDALAVGDWVGIADDAHGQAWLHHRLPPLMHLARRDADGRRHAVVSNVDTAVLVMGLDDDFNPRRLERYLSLVHGSGLAVVVVLTKADVVPAEAVDEAFERLRGRVPPATEVLALDATRPEAAAQLAPYLEPGQTLVLLGSSGAGKSTLTNTLIGTAVQDTGVVREHDSRGKHTTTSRSLHRLPGGACVIDTPGLRALSPDLDEDGVAASFGDIEALAACCRYRDCRHGAEPGCAVRDGVPADRLRNYQKLLREARRPVLTPLERRAQLAMWKARGREGSARAKAKRELS